MKAYVIRRKHDGKFLVGTDEQFFDGGEGEWKSDWKEARLFASFLEADDLLADSTEEVVEVEAEGLALAITLTVKEARVLLDVLSNVESAGDDLEPVLDKLKAALGL